MQFVVEDGWGQTLALSLIVQHLLLVQMVGSSLVGLSGARHLQDENRLARFVPLRPELEAVERRFQQTFGSDLY